jgi:hypothetical protein
LQLTELLGFGSIFPSSSAIDRREPSFLAHLLSAN